MLLLPLLAACAHSAPVASPKLQLELSRAIAHDEAAYRTEIETAIDHVVRWFGEHELPVHREELPDHAFVFVDVADARRGLSARLGVPAEQIPDGFSGTVIERTLYIVARDAYRTTYMRLYPDEPWMPAEYGKLIEHEVAHRAHAVQATRLYHSEEGMGPRWFFEGLALVCAEQFPHTQPATLDELRDAIAKDGSAGLGYATYARMVRTLASHFSIRWLVQHAGHADFVAEIERGWR